LKAKAAVFLIGLKHMKPPTVLHCSEINCI